MAVQVFDAYASSVKINQETLEGLQSIEFSETKSRSDIGAIGTDERIAVYFGMKMLSGKLRVASVNATLDGLLKDNKEFTISAQLKHGDKTRTLTFDSCYLDDKSFSLSAKLHAETIYTFTAARLREE